VREAKTFDDEPLEFIGVSFALQQQHTVKITNIKSTINSNGITQQLLINERVSKTNNMFTGDGGLPGQDRGATSNISRLKQFGCKRMTQQTTQSFNLRGFLMHQTLNTRVQHPHNTMHNNIAMM
jgi:hypothetical protein